MKVITPDWPAPSNIKACTTTKLLWGTPESLPSSETAHADLVQKLNLPSDPVWLKQTHSTIALPANPENKDREADASFTDQAHHICLVLTADCLPVLVCDRSGSHVAAIHAGWRGLAASVIENTVNAMSVDPKELMVWFGPAIGPQKFEVGADVYHAFTDHDPESAHCFQVKSSEKWLADLYQLAARRCALLGIKSIYGGGYCTYSQQDLFHSYRRDQQQTGRMASVIWIQR